MSSFYYLILFLPPMKKSIMSITMKTSITIDQMMI